jgi:hypothetical protein
LFLLLFVLRLIWINVNKTKGILREPATARS